VAIAFRAVSAKGTGTASPAAVNAPAGRVSGDLLIVYVAQDSTTRTITTPTGWNLVTGSPLTSSTHRSSVFWRIADGTTTDNFSATLSGATNWIAFMLAYSGVDGTTPLDGVTPSATSDASSVTVATTGTVTPSAASSLLVGLFSHDAVSAFHAYSPNSPAGLTERFDDGESVGFVAMCGDDVASTGATAQSVAVNISSAEVNNKWLLSLRAAAGGTPISATDANSTTTESASLTAAIAVSDQDGGTSPVESVTAIHTVTDVNGVLNEIASYQYFVSTSDSNGAVTESSAIGIPASDQDGVTSPVEFVTAIHTVTDSGSAATENSVVGLGVSDANGAISEIGNAVVPIAGTDANGATTEATTSVASYTATDANGIVTEITMTALSDVTAQDGSQSVTEAAIPAVKVAGSDSNGPTVEFGTYRYIISIQADTGHGTDSQAAAIRITTVDAGTAVEGCLQ
jgi:hypothetical protein